MPPALDRFRLDNQVAVVFEVSTFVRRLSR